MHVIFHIFHAAHAGGTRDRAALDGLRRLGCPGAGRWQRLFLAHAGLFLEGARAADSDAESGEPEPAPDWYTHVVEALAVEDWPTAVYCAGVLSRRVMDPLRVSHGAGPAVEARSACAVFAGVLGRAIAESRAIAPEVRLGAATLVAAVRAPGRMLARCWAGEGGSEAPAAGEAGTGAREPRAGQNARVVLFAPREREEQTNRTEEGRRQAGAEIIPLRRLAPAPSAQAVASNVTRQPMLFLVPGEAGSAPQCVPRRSRPLDEAPRLVWRRG